MKTLLDNFKGRKKGGILFGLFVIGVSLIIFSVSNTPVFRMTFVFTMIIGMVIFFGLFEKKDKQKPTPNE